MKRRKFLQLSAAACGASAFLGWRSPTAAASQHSFDAARRAVIVVDKSAFRTIVLQIQDDGLPQPVLTAPNAHAKPGYITPEGRFLVERVVLDPYWRNPFTGVLFSPYSRNRANPMGAAAITISSGIALHGTNQPDRIGTRVSHGCVRHHNEDITRMAYMVMPGTVVHVLASLDDFSQIPADDFSWETLPAFQTLNQTGDDEVTGL